ncbi:MAG: hydrogenase nickel incorporation protein HypB [Candidatus Theseobacter exili]|nr:hydrogenase nickel incorporation protein HypB [Candidatus Theseobacter exili]
MNEKTIKVYKDLMGANAEWAQKTRDLLKKKKVVMLNLIGSPGSGKTVLLERLAKDCSDSLSFSVLEGDVETTKDAERLQKLDILASQLLTGGACHLEAKLVHYALKDLPLDELDIVFVENVGNLVCPAEFDIGEEAKIAVLSVTEGEEKPSKYPLLFNEASAVVLTKTDLLPHLNYKIGVCMEAIKDVNGSIPVFQVDALNGNGVEQWHEWIKERVRAC